MWDRRLRNQARLGCCEHASPGRFDGVPHLTPEGMPLPEKVSMASVKILFCRDWAPYRDRGTSLTSQLPCQLLLLFAGLVKVVGEVTLMVGYTCQTRVRI